MSSTRRWSYLEDCWPCAEGFVNGECHRYATAWPDNFRTGPIRVGGDMRHRRGTREGEGPVSKHQVHPACREWGWREMKRPNPSRDTKLSGGNAVSQVGLTPIHLLMTSLLKMVTAHTHRHRYICEDNGSVCPLRSFYFFPLLASQRI